MSETNKTIFKPRARLLLQLGDQLIRNENIAVVELVKNSYDADAKNCEVVLINIDDAKSAEIVIQDDGIGMTPEMVKQVWLEPGADIKQLVLSKAKIPAGLSYTAKRTPIGEKGIGRFGVHKLGNYIEMVTKNAGSKNEVVVTIDWDKFLGVKYLDEANFDIQIREPKIFKKNSTGTKISIKKLRTSWSSILFKELQRSLLSLNSPFQTKSNFQVVTKLNLSDKTKEKEWKEKTISIRDIKDQALWVLKCKISNNEITDFLYEFKPWATMDKLSSKKIDLKSKEFQKVIKSLKTKDGDLNLGAHNIGDIEIEAYLYDLAPKILKLGVQNPQALAGFLSSNGGVRVYRDDMRVYNYGEPGDDWLNLDKTRINQPAQKIGNRNILAAVNLDRAASSDLREKTNREGFVEDDAFYVFQAAVQRVIEVFGQLRNIDKKKIRDLYEGSSKTQPVLHDIDELKELMEDRLDGLDSSDGDKKKFAKEKNEAKKELLNGLDRIKDQYIKTNSILLKSASAGLSLSVVIHEIEKRIKELSKALESDTENFSLGKVKTLVKSIAKLVDNYTVLIASEKKTKINPKQIIEDGIFNSEFRFKAHEIKIIKDYENTPDFKIECSLNTMVGVMLNIFDNSIYWLNYYGVEHKKIFIKIKKYRNNELGIIVADNGKGFALSAEDAIQPFVSMKPGGMGLGLHIVNEMVKAYNGRFIIRDFKETTGIPKEYSEGAIVELIFKIDDVK